MGYLDKSTITVDAILTNRGRELLAKGTGTGNFQITKFAVSDDEVDYGLYNTAHPLGSNYYGAIIENMPVLEATPDETQIMRYKLVTITNDEINERGGVVIPQITIQGQSIPPSGIVNIYETTAQGTTSITIRPETTYTSGDSGIKTETSYTLLLADSSLATVEVRTPNTGLINPNNRGSIIANGLEFTITARAKTGSTTVTVFGAESGAVYNFTLSVTAAV
jgi:hypothetical protein